MKGLGMGCIDKGLRLVSLAYVSRQPLNMVCCYPPPDSPIIRLSNFSRGAYRYTQDLLQLELASAPLEGLPYPSNIASPLRPGAWETALRSIPDRAFTSFLLRGIAMGFRIGVTQGARFIPVRRNRSSAYETPDVISAYLAREVELGRMAPLHPSASLSPPILQISPFGVIPKKNKPNKWRLIVDLSSPEGHSVNEAIEQDLCSVSYSSVDHAVKLAQSLGRGCLLAKLDLKEAYRAVPVHPSDQRFLAVAWNGTVYLDKALPFGLRSAPKLFSAVTDAMMWVLRDRGVQMALHYLDDFLVLGPPDQPTCAEALSTTLALCEELGFPVAEDKTEGPAAVITFLGIEIDTLRQQVRLPLDKLHRLTSTLAGWMGHTERPTPRSSVKKRELLSLLGLLHHAATVVRPGRAFLRNLIDASATVQALDHRVHLNAAARADLAWWHTFLRAWNGVSIMPPSDAPLLLVSDASGTWGCGAFHGNGWFQLQWPDSWAPVSIAPKELVPIVVAATLWGPQWAGKHVQCLCDNGAVVSAVNKGAAKDPILSHLLRIVAFLAAILDMRITARHLPGTKNAAADALSRNNLRLFLSLNPQASPVPAIIPPELRELMFNYHLRWTSPSWMPLLTSSWETALRLPPVRLTSQLSDGMQHSA